MAPSASNFPDTRFTLIRRLPNAEDLAAWETFVSIYVPVICSFALSRGCSTDQTALLAKSAMIRVAEAISDFQPNEDQPRFRDWLFSLVMEELRRKHPDLALDSHEIPRDGQMARALADAGEEGPVGQWNQEYRRMAYRRAVQEMELEMADTPAWEVFRRTILEAEDPESVAAELGMTLGAAYLARSRVLAKLRERIAAIEIDWESGAAQLSERFSDEST